MRHNLCFCFSFLQLSALSTQNVFLQNQLSAVTQNNLPKPNLLASVTSSTNGGVSSNDLNTLQLALQQQQQNLQQQLQSFLLQQPGTAQASAVLLHAQVQQAVTQATNQLKLLQNQRDAQQQQEILASVCQVLPDTPKSIPRSSPMDHVLPKTPILSSLRNKGERANDAFSNDASLNPLKIGHNKAALKAAMLKNQNKPSVTDALSNLLPIPPQLSTVISQSSPIPLSSSPHEFSRKPLLQSSSPPSPPLFTSLPSPLTSRPIPLSTTSVATSSSANNVMSNQTGFPRFPLIPQQQPTVPRLDLPADENVDLEELEQFAKEFKQRRIKLGTFKKLVIIMFSFIILILKIFIETYMILPIKS